MLSYCVVPGCDSGYLSAKKRYKAANQKNPSLFSTPKDPTLFRLWEIAIRRADRKLTRKDKVCAHHFQEEDIELFFITKIKDGTINKIERGKPFLRPDAVPCIFPNRPISNIKKLAELTVSTKSSKLLFLEKLTESVNTTLICGQGTIDSDNVRNHDIENGTFETSNKKNAAVNLTEKKHNELVSITHKERECATLIEEMPFIDDCFSYQKLCENLTIIKKPNNWWCITPTVSYIACGRWNDKHIVEKKVVISESLMVKVYLKEREIILSNQTEVNSIDDISTLLKKVESYEICAGVDQFKNCLVCLLDYKGMIGRPRKWCKRCNISMKTSMQRSRSQKTGEEIHVMKQKRLYRNLDNVKHKNGRLLQKVERLKRRLAIYEKMCPSIKSEIISMSNLLHKQSNLPHKESVQSSNDEDSDLHKQSNLLHKESVQSSNDED